MSNNKKKPSAVKTVFATMGCTVLLAGYMFLGMFVSVSFIEFDSKGNAVGWRIPGSEQVFAAYSPSALVGIETETEDNETAGQTEQSNDKKERSIEQKPRFEERAVSKSSKEENQEETQDTSDESVDSEEEEEKEEEEEEEEEETATVRRNPVDSVKPVDQAETAATIVSDVSQVVKAAMPCVVAITSEYLEYDYWYDEMVEEEANASGIIIGQNDDELLIVTNYHVVEDSLNLYVQFIDSSEATAYIKGTAPENDLAIVSVFIDDLADDTLDSIAIALLGNSDELQVGEPAIAIGNSLGYGQSVTTGIISALNRDIYEEGDPYNQGYLIQTDAAINPGNSGGALLNVRGEVIGINSSKIADYVIEGMGYAIPISNAKPIIDELVQMETRKKVDEADRGFLGISGKDVSSSAAKDYNMPKGVFVTSVSRRSGADEAGILKNDIIVGLDGNDVDKMTQLQNMLEYYEAGTEVEVTIMRLERGDYKEITLDVTLGHRD